MKKLLLVISALFATLFVNAQNTPAQSNEPKAEITFKESSHDFGDIVQGSSVTHVFEFKNTGKAPLVISNVSVTCGCTTPQWPREPILPGKKGTITATFNSTGKSGKQNKPITITSNAATPTAVVTIYSNVTTPPAPVETPAVPATK